MKRRLSALFAGFSLAALLLSLCSCRSLAEDREYHHPGGSDYSLVKQEGKWYLVFDEPEYYMEGRRPEAQGNPGMKLKFSSVQELRDTVIQGRLSPEQKAFIVKNFPSEEEAYPCCNFNRLFEPSLPEEAKLTEVQWRGKELEWIGYLGEDRNPVFSLRIISTEDRWERDRQWFMKQMESLEGVVIKDSRQEGDRKICYFAGEKYEYLLEEYPLQAWERRLIVQKEYRVAPVDPEKDFGASLSSTVPIGLALFGKEKGCFFKVQFSEPQREVSDRWLLEFGLQDMRGDPSPSPEASSSSSVSAPPASSSAASPLVSVAPISTAAFTTAPYNTEAP